MLSPAKKSDRAKMVERIRILAADAPFVTCEFTLEGSSPYYKRGFHVYLHCANGLNASLTVDANGQNTRDDVYVIAWFMDTKSDAKLSADFESSIGPVNRYHRHKATSVVRGFDMVLGKLEAGMAFAANGRAFMQAESVS